jgi:hypothetical protein
MNTNCDRCAAQEIQEIDGYLELGMEQQALDMIGEKLVNRPISEAEFHGCVFGLLQTELADRWRPQVETAYRSLQQPVGDEVRSAMLNFYFSLNEPATAFQFFPRRSTRFFDAWTMMQVCLELHRFEEAKKVARYCRGVLRTTTDSFTKASMADALAHYHMRIGDHEEALNLWDDAPAEPAFERQRLTGRVKARLHQALATARAGLKIATEKKDLSIADSSLRATNEVVSDSEAELMELELRIAELLDGQGSRRLKS